MNLFNKLKLTTPKIAVIAVILLLAVSASVNLMQRQESSPVQKTQEYVIDESDYIKGNELIKDIQAADLSSEEVSGLILMREEEKLARDVYLTLGETWGLKIFTNIAASEQTHTDAVKVLLDRYSIEDPVKTGSVGSFTSTEMRDLYVALTAQGQTSLLEALKVGATVEDLDINDLNNLLANTDNEDIIATYNNLLKGSRNHLRAYIKQIDSNGGSYSPVYITQDLFQGIIGSSQERGRAR